MNVMTMVSMIRVVLVSSFLIFSCSTSSIKENSDGSEENVTKPIGSIKQTVKTNFMVTDTISKNSSIAEENSDSLSKSLIVNLINYALTIDSCNHDQYDLFFGATSEIESIILVDYESNKIKNFTYKKKPKSSITMCFINHIFINEMKLDTKVDIKSITLLTKPKGWDYKDYSVEFADTSKKLFFSVSRYNIDGNRIFQLGWNKNKLFW